jgi:hypothetical protein
LGNVAKIRVSKAVSYYSWNKKLLNHYDLGIESVPFLRLQMQSEVTQLGPIGKAILLRLLPLV